MEVSFLKSGVHRYGVNVERDCATNLQMHPAPGYDDWLPHDMVHFLVEREVGLRDGIFGQLAAGGDANTFVPTEQQRTRRWARRTERRNRATGRDIGRSEELAFAALVAWKCRAARHRATHQCDEAAMTEVEALLPALDDAAHTWHALSIGESLTFTWPWPERASK
ncbi:MAG TPA: hypothetical protein VFU85_10975 [Nocardioides sp.]|nr:hypothetical protein [Nocardioides sp.]